MTRMQEELDNAQSLSVPWLLPEGSESVTLARHAARRHLTALGVAPEIIDTAELLVSELTANVIKHAGGRPTLRVMRHDDVIRIEVGDSRPDQFPVARDLDTEAPSGRGLLLVTTLATSWGYELDGDGKFTWAELEMPQ